MNRMWLYGKESVLASKTIALCQAFFIFAFLSTLRKNLQNWSALVAKQKAEQEEKKREEEAKKEEEKKAIKAPPPKPAAVRTSSKIEVPKEVLESDNEWKRTASFVHCSVKSCYKEHGYNKTLLKQGSFAGPSSLNFCLFLPNIMRNLIQRCQVLLFCTYFVLVFWWKYLQNTVGSRNGIQFFLQVLLLHMSDIAQWVQILFLVPALYILQQTFLQGIMSIPADITR